MTEDLAVRETPVSLFDSDEPGLLVQHATRIADQLTQVINKRNLSVTISGRQHVRVEGWTMLGSMLGVFPSVVWMRPVADQDGKPYGWEARVEARTRGGELVGAAQAVCLRTEQQWRNRDDYALYSMAQTRATSKALRQPLGFVISLAGFDATPAEEIPPVPRQAVRDKPVVDVELEAESIPFGEPDEREQLTITLLNHASTLGFHDETASMTKAHRERESEQAHLAWLRKQIAKAEGKLLDLQEQEP